MFRPIIMKVMKMSVPETFSRKDIMRVEISLIWLSSVIAKRPPNESPLLFVRDERRKNDKTCINSEH